MHCYRNTKHSSRRPSCHQSSWAHRSTRAYQIPRLIWISILETTTGYIIRLYSRTYIARVTLYFLCFRIFQNYQVRQWEMQNSVRRQIRGAPRRKFYTLPVPGFTLPIGIYARVIYRIVLWYRCDLCFCAFEFFTEIKSLDSEKKKFKIVCSYFTLYENTYNIVKLLPI